MAPRARPFPLTLPEAGATKSESLASRVIDHLHTQVSDQEEAWKRVERRQTRFLRRSLEERRSSTTAARKAKEDCRFAAFCRLSEARLLDAFPR